MKRTMFAIIAGTALSALCNIAVAGGQQSLATVTVHSNTTSPINCTPPNSSPDCAAFHALIRANFSPREIGMLFGARTSYPQYQASYDRVKARYDAMESSFVETRQAASMNTLASK